MSAQTLDVIRDRIASLCASAPFDFGQAQTPFSFRLQPTGNIDQVFRLEVEAGPVIGGFNYSEERTDDIRIWVARKHQGNTEAMYRQLVTDASSLRAAVVRDGLVQGGDYSVPDSGGGVAISQDAKQAYGVLRLTLPVNFEAQL